MLKIIVGALWLGNAVYFGIKEDKQMFMMSIICSCIWLAAV